MGNRMRALRHRTGRRGLFLLFLATLDAIIGWFILYPPRGTPPQPYPLIPHTAWGWAWLMAAAASLTGAFLKDDRVAFALAAVIKAGWGLRWAYLWFRGVPFAWVSMVIWLTFAATVLVIASWPEAPVITLPPEGGTRG